MDASDWDQRYSTTELVWTADANRFVISETENISPGHAVDLGGGEGRNAVWLAERGWEVTVVDFSQVALDKGRQLADASHVANHIEWVCADVRVWNPRPASVDLIVVAYLHLPAEELATALTHAGGGLAPGGTIVVVGHDLANLEGGVGGPQDPAVLYTPDRLSQLLSGVGLEVTQAATVERPTPNGTALDTLATAVAPHHS